MSYCAHRFLIGILATGVVFAQIGGPQYPPGSGGGGTGYPRTGSPGGTGGMGLPRIPMPGKKKKNGKGPKVDEDKIIVVGLRGMLRKLDDKRIILQADDKRLLQIIREDETKFLKAGQEAKLAEFVLGDHVWVETYKDDDGLFHSLRMTWEKEATETERASAKGPLPESVQFEDDRPAGAAEAEAKAKRGGDDGPPKMARKGEVPKPAPEAKPAAAVVAVPPVEIAEARDNGTLIVDKVDLEAVPTLRRGRPAPRRRDADDDATAPVSAAPPVMAGAASGTPQVEAPQIASPQKEAVLDPLIEKAREIAFEFSESLPNYLAKQVTTRFVGEGKKDRWQAQDNFTAEVVYQDGKESYRNVLLNGKPAKGKIEQTGSWSRGEFGTTLRDVLSPASNAVFKPKGTTTISTRKAKLYEFNVEQENSHWQIGVPGQTYFPAYRGSIWIDVETSRVMRIEMQGRKIPQDFPVDAVESAVEWDFVKIGTGSYLVPVHAESLSCMRSLSQCSKNVMDFRNYKKFGAQSELILNQ